MKRTEIPAAAIERNKVWIEAVTHSLGTQNTPELLRNTMREAGKKCAAQILEKTIRHFGRTPTTVDEMIDAINTRRKEVLRASTFWVRKGNKAYFTLEKCSCDLVEAGLAEPNPHFCLCSAGMFECLFSPFHQGAVRTEIVKAIGRGDECCKFIVHFDE